MKASTICYYHIIMQVITLIKARGNAESLQAYAYTKLKSEELADTIHISRSIFCAGYGGCPVFSHSCFNITT